MIEILHTASSSFYAIIFIVYLRTIFTSTVAIVVVVSTVAVRLCVCVLSSVQTTHTLVTKLIQFLRRFCWSWMQQLADCWSSGHGACKCSFCLVLWYNHRDHDSHSTIIISRQRLRSAQRCHLDVPRHNRSTLGRRSFSVTGPIVWNSLPDELRDQGCTESTFKQSLKTYLFAQH